MRRDEDECGTLGNKLKFLHLERQLGVLLRLFTSGDLVAHLARMLAIERLGKGRADGFRLEILREHVRPRDGLQYSPMPAGRAEQRDDQQDMAETNEHAASIISKYDWGRKFFARRHDNGTDDCID